MSFDITRSCIEEQIPQATYYSLEACQLSLPNLVELQEDTDGEFRTERAAEDHLVQRLRENHADGSPPVPRKGQPSLQDLFPYEINNVRIYKSRTNRFNKATLKELLHILGLIDPVVLAAPPLGKTLGKPHGDLLPGVLN